MNFPAYGAIVCCTLAIVIRPHFYFVVSLGMGPKMGNVIIRAFFFFARKGWHLMRRLSRVYVCLHTQGFGDIRSAQSTVEAEVMAMVVAREIKNGTTWVKAFRLWLCFLP